MGATHGGRLTCDLQQRWANDNTGRKESLMKYLKRWYKDNAEWEEVTYQKALDTVLSTFNDNAEVRSMLTIGNYIPCRYSEIRVYDDKGMTALPGQTYLFP